MTSVLSAVVRGPFVPLGRAVDRRKDSGAAELQPLSVYLEAGVVPRASRDDNYNRLGADLSDYLIVEPGDVVFNKLRTWQGGFGVSKHAGIVSPAYYVCRPRSDYEPRFLQFLLRSSPYLAELTRISKFMPPSQFDILWEDLRAVPIPKVALVVQRAIADFLDTETARIDALITKKRQMVELLAARYQATIDEAFIGIAQCVSVRHLVSRLTSGPRGWSGRSGDVGQPFIRITNIRRASIELDHEDLLRVEDPGSAEARRCRVKAGDVLVSITADVGSVGVAEALDHGGFISQHVALMTPVACEGEWLAYAIKGSRTQQNLQAGQYGGTKTQLSLGDIASLKIPVPSADERRRRLAWLREKHQPIRSAGTALARQIALLQERRQALITAAVSGELEIPGVAA